MTQVSVKCMIGGLINNYMQLTSKHASNINAYQLDIPKSAVEEDAQTK